MNDPIIIKNGQLLSPELDLNSPTLATLIITDGKIESIIPNPHPTEQYQQNAQIIDATGCWVVPSFIDLCHYLREPGYEHKGTIATETRAAAAAGFTHIVAPPMTQPIVDTPAVVNLIQKMGAAAGHCSIYLLGAMTHNLDDQQLSEMHALKEAGCIGVYHGDATQMDNRTLLRCIEYAGTFDLPVYFRPIDASLSKGGLMHEGSLSNRLGIPGIPACAETIALTRDLQLVEMTGIKAHFSRISCKKSVEIIAEAKAKGLDISCDVSLQHLLYTDQTLSNFNSLYMDYPPFRTEEDRRALIDGLLNDTIDAICSNHQPHDLASKMAPLGESQSGLSTLDLFVPNLLRLSQQEEIPFAKLMNKVSQAPAQLLRKQCPKKVAQLPSGTISTGGDAHVTIINPKLEWEVNSAQLLSIGQNCTQMGQTVKGGTLATLREGKIVCSKSV